jgi:hypothetical protein
MTTYPIAANGEMCDPAQTETYLNTLFRHVDIDAGAFAMLGVGEKGTPKGGTREKDAFQERKFVPFASPAGAHAHIRRWGEHHVGSFIVPAGLHPSAIIAGHVTVDKIALLTAIVLDLDSGDISSKAAYVIERLGLPTMTIGSGGATDLGEAKRHLYWLFNEPTDEIDRVAALRKLLAAKVGGDQSFGRATQIIRIPGSVHAKNGVASLCSIIETHDVDYSLDDLAEIIEAMEPMPGIEPVQNMHTLPLLTLAGGMDFSRGAGLETGSKALAALHQDVHEGGDVLTRFSEASSVFGFQISEARAGRVEPEQAFANAMGWMAQHMLPAWPAGRAEQEFRRLLALDVKNHGPLPVAGAVIAAEAAKGISASHFIWRDPASLPPRRWVFGRWLLRNTVTAIVAPGGVGKSSLMASMMLSLTTGRPILKRDVWDGPMRAWYWNLEDDGDELARQLHASAMHHGIRPQDCGDRLYIDSGPDGAGLCTAIDDRTGFRILDPVNDAIIEQIVTKRIDVMVVDPFVSSHQVDENANTYIDAITKKWAYIAKQTGCAIGLVHHTKKLAGQKATAEASRGASALVNTARSVLVLNRMLPEEGEYFGIERGKEARFFNVQDDKHNRAPAEKAGWYEMVSVELGNGDNVGVVSPWKPPAALDGVEPQHLIDVQRICAHGEHRQDPQSADWVGNVVATVMRLDVDNKAVVTRIKKIVEQWIKSGFLEVYQVRNKATGYKPKPFVRTGAPYHPEGMVTLPDAAPMDFTPKEYLAASAVVG